MVSEPRATAWAVLAWRLWSPLGLRALDDPAALPAAALAAAPAAVEDAALFSCPVLDTRDGTPAELRPAGDGRLLRYDFAGRREPWAGIASPIPGGTDVRGRALVFAWRGSGGNTLQVKARDGAGRVLGRLLPRALDDRDWQRAELRLDCADPLWAERAATGDADRSDIERLVIVAAGYPGDDLGDGFLEVRGLGLRAARLRPPDGPVFDSAYDLAVMGDGPPRPVVRSVAGPEGPAIEMEYRLGPARWQGIAQGCGWELADEPAAVELLYRARDASPEVEIRLGFAGGEFVHARSLPTSGSRWRAVTIPMARFRGWEDGPRGQRVRRVQIAVVGPEDAGGRLGLARLRFLPARAGAGCRGGW
jgi:hypothetical protein